MNRIIGERLKKFRVEKNLSVFDLAHYLGVSKYTYQSYELGINEPDISKLVCLARYYNIDLDYLLGNEVDRVDVLLNKLTNLTRENKLDWILLGRNDRMTGELGELCNSYVVKDSYILYLGDTIYLLLKPRGAIVNYTFLAFIAEDNRDVKLSDEVIKISNIDKNIGDLVDAVKQSMRVRKDIAKLEEKVDRMIVDLDRL